MADVRAKFVNSFDGQSQIFGVRLDVLDNMQLFRTSNDIRNLMKFLSACGIKFLNIGSIFARQNEKTISSFAIDGNILSPAVLDETFPAEETIDRIMDFLIGTIRKPCGQNLQIFATSTAIGSMDILYIVPYLPKLAPMTFPNGRIFSEYIVAEYRI
jgi:hypothetical protein